MVLEIEIVNKSPHPLPNYHTVGAAGMDLQAWLQQPWEIKPFERILVPTGISLALPEGFEAQIRPRSGLAWKQGITLVNSPGTIDSDYRGEIKILLINLSHDHQIIKNGDRIAQLVIARYENIRWQPVTALPETIRSAGGFGHTGR